MKNTRIKIKTYSIYKYVIISIIGLLILKTNNVYSQGPNAPEAGAFEPVDATDMVNLVTGDFIYVLPLLHVPSPEGGYPLALSYHAGIAMDQEASWSGLGWSVNPGTINRNVNGYPDDWANGAVRERFWNEGQQLYQNSVGISFSYGLNIGLDVSWGSLRGFGGSIDIGVGYNGYNAGVNLNSNGSIGLSVGTTNGLGLNASLNRNGGINSIGASLMGKTGLYANIGYGKNGLSGGFGVNSGTGLKNFFAPKNESIGMSFSSKGTSASFSVGGTSAYTGMLAKAPGEGDAVVDYDTEYYFIPGLSFTRERLKWHLSKISTDYISGALYINKTEAAHFQSYEDWCYSTYGADSQEVLNDCLASNYPGYNPISSTDATYMDLKEMSSGKVNMKLSNPTVPNIDLYNVTAQGMSGMITPKISQNGLIEGAQRDYEGYELKYLSISNNDQFKYSTTPPKVRFEFQGEFNSAHQIEPITFNDAQNPSSIDNIINFPMSPFSTKPNRQSNFVEFFTHADINDGSIFNFLDAKDTSNIPVNDDNQIRAFRITDSDGKVYHYSLPVYSMEERTRIFKEGQTESQAFYEQTKPSYATHWLLTAITGPDYVKTDINRGYPEEGDYGYWVRFDYGYLSQSVWRSPININNFDEDEGNNVYSWGKTQKYYLDKIKTRTHSALFLKNNRLDANRVTFSYYHSTTSPVRNVFGIDLVRLDKIVLLKNEYADQINKSSSNNNGIPYAANIFNSGDVESSFLNEYSEKTIEFQYSYELAKGSNNSNASSKGRLTLDALKVLGKNGTQALPPYKFDYIGKDISYVDDSENQWGYSVSNQAIWSLNEIQTPTGAKLNIEYEPDTFSSVIVVNSSSVTSLYNYSTSSVSGTNISLQESHSGAIQVGDSVEYFEKTSCICGACEDNHNVCTTSGKQQGIVTNVIDNFNIQVDIPISFQSNNCYEPYNCTTTGYVKLLSRGHTLIGSGLRVKSLNIESENNIFTTRYSYNSINNEGVETNNTSGKMPYFPSEGEYVPYVSELPSPVTMYEFVKVENLDNSGDVSSWQTYQFNVFKGVINEGDVINNDRMGYLVTSTNAKNVGRFEGYYSTAKEFTLESNFGALGQVKTVKLYNKHGNLLNISENNYVTSSMQDPEVNIESFFQLKRVVNPDNDFSTTNKFSSTKVITKPTFIKSAKTVQRNYSSIIHFDKFDINTGQALTTRTIDSKGTELETKIIPAYSIPEYSGNLDQDNNGFLDGYGMGSKVDNHTNKNMLTQTAASLTKIKDASGNWKTINTNITTWNNDWTYRNYNGTTETPTNDVEKIWRKHKTYAWRGDVDTDGTYQGYTGDFDNFNWTNPEAQTNPKWIKTSTVSLYDHYSMPLETIDINKNRVATKMMDNSSKIAAVANAGYTEMFYSGAEYKSGNYIGNEIQGGNFQNAITAHTGKFSLSLSPGDQGFKILMKANDKHRAGRYKASVWVNTSNVNDTRIHINGESKPFNGEEITAGNWTQLNHYEELSAGDETVYITASANAIYADDFRLHPVASSMTSYVYNEWDELTDILGSNNLATHYEYDSAGRLIRIYTEVVKTANFDGGINLVKEIGYRYKSQEEEDNIEVDPPFTFSWQINHTNSFSARITITTYNSSGNLSYRWAVGQPGESGHDQLTFGSWNNNPTQSFVDELCQGIPFKVQVRDNDLGQSSSKQSFYLGNCNSGGNNGEEECQNCGEQF